PPAPALWPPAPPTADAASARCSPSRSHGPHQMLVEMLDREALIALAIKPLHLLRPVRRDPPARRPCRAGGRRGRPRRLPRELRLQRRNVRRSPRAPQPPPPDWAPLIPSGSEC